MNTNPARPRTRKPPPPACRKCGGTRMDISYHRHNWDCSYSDARFGTCDVPHLHHHCQTCGFAWTTPPLDALNPDAKSA